jgi:hypothetical protein
MDMCNKAINYLLHGFKGKVAFISDTTWLWETNKGLFIKQQLRQKVEIINCKLDCIFVQITVTVKIFGTSNTDKSSFLIKREDKLQKYYK